ncbi:hypothetical protein [uncultured Desulfovibrio sp.]|uniref:hypothetical protein n=1 Tax=uncultured Desulfovibrio sp. TaxID=167968 RepID=UPI0026198C04|nr:hypothetical protein [uncultured Desulfovibrio sp.]
MKRIFAVCGGSLLAVLLLTVAVRAEEVKSKYFTLDIPSGWKVEMSQEKEGLAFFIVADSQKKNLVNITITSLPEPMSAKELCTMTCDSLKAAGVQVGEPVVSGETYAVEFSQGEAQGWQYFTSIGKLASTVSFIGDGGKEVLQKNLKPVDPKLFPASY